MDLVKEKTELTRMVNEAKTLYATLEGVEVAKRSADDVTKLNNLLDAGEAKRAEIARYERLMGLKGSVEPEESLSVPLDTQRPAPAVKSWGRALIASDQYKAELKTQNPRNVDPVAVKALYESTSARGGALVFSERRTEITDNARYRDRTLLDALNISGTDSNVIDYVALTAFSNNAAEVTEWTGTDFGLKPESDMTFAARTAAVKTIAHWIRESRNIMRDAPRLQNLIDTKLVDGLELRLETQILNGNGTGDNLMGILSTVGIQNRVQHGTTPVGRNQTTTTTTLDTIRMALTDIRLAFYRPDAIVLNPSDAEAIELAKDSTNNYLNVFDPVAMRVWRTRVIETQAIAAKTGLVADMSGATLYVREDAEVRISENVSDDFIRNAVRVLAEMRAALAVTDVSAFEKITFA